MKFKCLHRHLILLAIALTSLPVQATMDGEGPPGCDPRSALSRAARELRELNRTAILPDAPPQAVGHAGLPAARPARPTPRSSQPVTPARGGRGGRPVLGQQDTHLLLPCCRDVDFGEVRRSSITPDGITESMSFRDTVYSMGSRTRGGSRPAPDGYTFSPPQSLGQRLIERLQRVLPERVRWSAESYDARLQAHIARNPRLHGLVPTSIEDLGGHHGGMSRVYILHPSVPGTVLPAQRTQWIWEHAIEVVKLRGRRVEAMLDPRTSLDQVINKDSATFRRDLVMGEFARELFERVQYRGESLIEVERLTSSLADQAEGVMAQRPVRGPTAFALSEAISEYRYMNGRVSSAAQNVMRQAGIDLHGSAESVAAVIQDMEGRLRAVEQAYADIHPYVSAFEERNFLATYANHTQGFDEAIEVGLDANHGRNLIWDARRRVFVAIDY